jgi:hypothetical protein
MTAYVPTKGEIIQGIQNWNRHVRESSGRKERDIIDVYAERELQLSDSDYQYIIKKYSRGEDSREQFFGYRTTHNPNSLDFAETIMYLVDDAKLYIHVLTDPPFLRLGLATDIVKNEVFHVSYFSELLLNGKVETPIEHDIENKVLGFLRERRPTFYEYDYKAKLPEIHHVKAEFNKEDLWYELVISFYGSHQEVLGAVPYAKKDCDWRDPRWREVYERMGDGN